MSQNHPEPPQPPNVERKIAFHRVELIGMSLIALIPLLALLNVFGLALEKVEAADQQLALRVEHIARGRQLQLAEFAISVENHGDAVLPLVTVSVARDYIEQFTQVMFTPDVAAITDQAYEIELEDVQPGETRFITVDLRPTAGGQHTGTVSAAADGGASVSVTFNTLVFP